MLALQHAEGHHFLGLSTRRSYRLYRPAKAVTLYRVLRLLIGLLKGAAIGGAVGFAAYSLNFGGAMLWLTYGLVGALVGALVGKPLWAHLVDRTSTVVTPILKAIVGAGIAIGMFAIVAKAWGGFDLQMDGETRNIYQWQHIMGAAIGALYGAFVELDDASDQPENSKESKT